MTSRADSQPNHTVRPPLSDCQKQMEAVLAELRRALAGASGLTEEAPAEQRELIESDLCLASRSAYFDFYTWVVLHETIDEPAERELHTLFQQTLAAMRDGRYKESVQKRYEEFAEECRRVRESSSLFCEPVSSF